jgi:hypothetical protein
VDEAAKLRALAGVIAGAKFKDRCAAGVAVFQYRIEAVRCALQNCRGVRSLTLRNRVCSWTKTFPWYGVQCCRTACRATLRR